MDAFNIPAQAAVQQVQQPKPQTPKEQPKQRTERRDGQKSETKTLENGIRAEVTQQVSGQDEAQVVQQGQQTEESSFLAMMLQQMSAVKEGIPADSSMDAQLLAALQEQLKKDGAENGMELLAALLSANQAVSVTDISALLTQDAGAVIQGSGAVTTNAAQLLEILTAGQQNTQAAQQTQQNGEFAELVSVQQNTVQGAAQENAAQNGTAQDGMSGEAQFKQSVLQAQQMLKSKAAQGEAKEDSQTIDIDQLQSKVDANKAVNLQRTDFRMQDFAVKESGQLSLPDAKDLLQQVQTGIQQGLNTGKNEFIVKLKPDGLGEITVRLEESGGKMALSIFTSSTQVQRMISSEMAGLREVMKPLGVEVQQVASQEAGHFDTQQQNNFGGHQHQQFQEDRQSQQYWYNGSADDSVGAEEQYIRQSVGNAALDTYI